MPAIPADRCVGGRDLTEPRLSADGSVLGYVAARAGTACLVVHRFDGSEDQRLATTPAIRPGRGLGGGAWCFAAHDKHVVYVAVDGELWWQSLAGEPAVQLSSHGGGRSVSGPVAAADGSCVVHVLDMAEVHRVSLTDCSATRLDDGSADFCLDPFVEADSRAVRWLAWDVPDMPWDRSRVQRCDRDGVVRDHLRPEGAVQQARALPDGSSICVRDDSGWLNVWLGDAPLLPERCEHAGPTWGPGQQSYAWSPDGRSVAFTRNEAGFGRMCVVDRVTGATREVARGVHGHLSWQGSRLAAVRTGARTPTQIVVYDTESWDRTAIAVGPGEAWSGATLREPTLLEVPVADGVVHARLYTADNADGRLLVWLHGGPTDQWPVTFMPRLEFWLSRGWSIVVPDHRGSTGHGRAYQQALRGRWGQLDVADILAVTSFAHSAGFAQRSRTVIIGGSAGGFTALGVVAAAPGRFAAAVLSYPVTDLSDLAECSHRFERHYTDSLIGPLPDAIAAYQQRSPTWHADRYTLTPMLLLHGELDAVVPVEQSRVFVQRVLAAGGDIELCVYAGEGHGFRRLTNQVDEYRRIEEFLARCVPVDFEA